MTPVLLAPASATSAAVFPQPADRGNDAPVVALAAAGCRTPLGDTRATADALLRGQRALQMLPVRGQDGGDLVPLGLIDDWQPAAGAAASDGQPRWEKPLLEFLQTSVPDRPWGQPRFPVFITSSNFGIGELYAYFQDRADARLPYLLPHQLTAWFGARLGWGGNVTHFSHACVSSNLGLLYASRQVGAGLADEALVVTYDFLSPFVAAGFHALKILFNALPAPYAEREFGAVGLGDGVAFAVITRPRSSGDSGFRLEAQAGANEMYHFTGNHPDGIGMGQLAVTMRAAAEARGQRVWVKGHGTGTIEAGRLEARHMSEAFPGAPLVSWKGALGHTLGSCGLVELALAMEFIRRGQAPGTIGSEGEPCFSAEVATAPFALGEFTGCVLNSYAFGGAHYAFLLGHG
ncbi:MAG: hypothetical protein JO117_03380 [Verrucomicrobia bacterium]|nr:hypothetical protein [Verrucomicrobiota bacterium]